ncbi:BTAD domain-containing putative transcriptional regulator [Aquihabitans daechungensis]|uniref:BTAD domain-containing putative transcriptional regulator n=1 Tax=Aquihabitans daechungensis TaxID=1052257 RepID=UPI003B9EF149
MRAAAQTELVRAEVPCAMEVRVLGPLDVRHAGEPVAIRRGHPRSLLTLLALRSPHVVPADVLIDRMWGENLPANPANALQLQVSYLRRTLGSVSGGEGVLRTEGDGYRLALDPECLDLHRFERLAAEASAAGTPEARFALSDEALTLWRGDPLAEVAGLPEVLGDLARLEQRYLSLAELRIDALMELGREGDAIVDLGPLVASFPLHERFYAQLMICLYRAGRQTEALQAFQSIRERLVDELGLSVGPELVELEAQVLTHDPSIANPRSAPPSLIVNSLAEVRPRAPLTSLVGRTETVDRVIELLVDRRLVTLTGPGGAGKTRVAVGAVEQLPDAGAVWFVDLGAVAADDDVARAMADALRVPTIAGEPASGSLQRAFADAEGLLVLDTCEHVVDQVMVLVEELLAAAPALRVLATSRRPLGIGGELAWPVAPLSLPVEGCADVGEAFASEAVRLFCDRAVAVRPDFALTATNVGDVVSICRGMDGLPLAIELAAAHADVLSPAAIRSRVAGHLELLRGHGAAGPERHRALRTTIGWSVDLLEERERELLAMLSVFAGSFDLEAAAALAGVDDVLPSLAPLIRQSLVTVVPDDRYRLLDAVRSFAGSLLDNGPEERARSEERHAAFFIARARAADREIRGAGQVEVVAALERDLPNYRAALRWSFEEDDGDLGANLASALAWMWTVHGNTSEADLWLRRALERDGLSDPARIRTLLAASMVAAPSGDLARSLDLSLEAAALAERSGLPVHRATGLLNAGVASWALGRYEESADQLEVSMALYRDAGRRRGEALAAMNLGRTSLDGGDLDRSGVLLDHAAALSEDGGDPQLRSLVVYLQARRALALGQPELAEQLAAISLAHGEELDHHETMAASLHILGCARLTSGDLDQAEQFHRRALDIAVATNHIGAAIEAIEALGEVAAERGEGLEASMLLAAAGAERSRRGLPVPGSDAERIATLRARMPSPVTALSLSDAVERVRSTST